MNARHQTSMGIFLTIALASLAAAGCQAGGEPAEEHDDEIANVVEVRAETQSVAGFQTTRAGAQAIQRVIRTTGVVTAAQPRVAQVRPLTRGVVQEIFVQFGDWVQAGQPLLVYDSIELGESIGEYLDLLGGLHRQEARRNVAEKSLARAEALLEEEGIARSVYELRVAEYEQTIAEIESQRAGLTRVEEKLRRFGMSEEEVHNLDSQEPEVHRYASLSTLRAPLTGAITSFEVARGEVIDPEIDLFTVIDTSVVWVLADVYEKDIGAVTEGSEVRITLPSFPDEEFGGTIEYISDVLDRESRSAKVRCVVANADRRLKLEMFGTVEIPVPLASAAVAVPTIALQEIEGQTVVFVQQTPTRFEKRAIRIGARGQEWVEVLEGLTVGETLITEGSFYLKSMVLRGSIGEEH